MSANKNSSRPATTREERHVTEKPQSHTSLARSKTFESKHSSFDWGNIKKIAVPTYNADAKEIADTAPPKNSSETAPQKLNPVINRKTAGKNEKAETVLPIKTSHLKLTDLKNTPDTENPPVVEEKTHVAEEKKPVAEEKMPPVKKPARKLAFNDLKKFSERNKLEKEKAAEQTMIPPPKSEEKDSNAATLLAALIKNNSGEVRRRVRRTQAESGDVLSSLTEKQLRREADEAERESAERVERENRAKIETQKRVAGLLAANRWEKVEFYGYFKGARDAVDAQLWEIAFLVL